MHHLALHPKDIKWFFFIGPWILDIHLNIFRIQIYGRTKMQTRIRSRGRGSTHDNVITIIRRKQTPIRQRQNTKWKHKLTNHTETDTGNMTEQDTDDRNIDWNTQRYWGEMGNRCRRRRQPDTGADNQTITLGWKLKGKKGAEITITQEQTQMNAEQSQEWQHKTGLYARETKGQTRSQVQQVK